MPRRIVPLATTLLIAGIELLTGGCGNTSAPSRLLQSVSVTPAVANAQTFSNGQVQFTAVGTYSQPPSPSPITQPGGRYPIQISQRLARAAWRDALRAHRE